MVRIVVIGAPPLTVGKQCYSSFVREGHETRYFNYRMLQGHRFGLTNRILNYMIIRLCARFKPDLVLTVKGESLLPGTINAVRKQGAYAVNWMLDEPTGKYYPSGKVSNLDEYDQVFSFDRSYIQLIKRLGAPKVDFLPSAVDETLYTEQIPLGQRNYICDISFIGTYWPEREKLLNAVAGKNLRIYGPGWNKKLAADSPLRSKLQRKIIEGPAACRYFNLSRINVNLTHKQAVDGGINLRIPEILATRSFLMTNELKGLSDLFVPGKELVTYSSPEDFARKVERYLKDPAARDAIAEAGYRKLLAKHTVTHRIRTMLQSAGL